MMMYSAVRHKMKLATAITTRLLSGESSLIRTLSTTVSPPNYWPRTTPKINKAQLYNKLSGVGKTGQNLTDALHQLMQNGVKLENADLAFCLKKLRKYGRFQHCAEILDWMEKGSDNFSDHGLRLDITYRLHGIDEAERYFSNIPPHANQTHACGTLLHCYCSEKMPVKALALFRKMEEMDIVSNNLVFDNLMGLYMKLDQPEKVPPLVQEMKQRNIPLSSSSYQLWLQSCGHLKDPAGIEQVMEEVKGHEVFKREWRIYSCLAIEYSKVGQPESVASALKKFDEILDHPNLFDRDAYHHLISLSAKSGNVYAVFQAWGKLNSKFKDCYNRSYLIMLQALSRLDMIEPLRNLLEEWESRHKSYDGKIPSVAIDAYLKHGMLEEAQSLLNDVASRKAGQKLWFPYVSFIYYYLGKQQIDLSLSYLESAISEGWRPDTEKFGPLFEFYKQQKDFHGAEKLCKMLTDIQALDSRAYLWLLQTYAAAGEKTPEMRQRMKDDGIDISSEHEELLQNICQN